ncbi:MAG: hypothetical protein BAA03_09885 [Caldibacillus debilis]|nr:MAG: hypothetical protein BAA03_09885 [Caldibacillus debilis]
MTAGKFRQNDFGGGNFKRRKGAGPSRDGFFRKNAGPEWPVPLVRRKIPFAGGSLFRAYRRRQNRIQLHRDVVEWK